jgi:DNA-binding NarL/FixJ family response regulator
VAFVPEILSPNHSAIFARCLDSQLRLVRYVIAGPSPPERTPHLCLGSAALRILIADDHDLMRHGLTTLLKSREGWEICAEARTGFEAVSKAEKLQPDIAILDIAMPGLNGLDAARKIRRASPQTEILVLSVHYSDQLIRDILDAGVRGYVVKSDSDRDLVLAVEALANHQPFFTSRVTEVMLDGWNTPSDTSAEVVKSRLSSRQREIVQLLSEGMTSKEVGLRLNISAKTVETHRAHIMRKLQLHSISELVRYAVRNRIVEA